MRRIKAGWWTLILMLVVLLAPVHAHADYWWQSQSGPDPGGDPDQPIGPGLSPNQRAGGIRGGDVKPRSVQVDRTWMGRYLTLLSGLRSFYLRF